MRFFVGLALTALSAGVANAGFLYELSFLPQSGPIQALSIEFTLPHLITSEGNFSIPPATMTDGTHVWTLTQAAATDSLGFACFAFGTASVVMYASGCGATFTPADGVAISSAPFSLQNLPVTEGTWSNPAWMGDLTGYAGTTAITSGAGSWTLTVSSTPEPAGFVLVPLALVAFAAISGRNGNRTVV